MNVADSGAWLEYVSEGVNADFFAPAIENTPQLVVPTLSVSVVTPKRCRPLPPCSKAG